MHFTSLPLGSGEATQTGGFRCIQVDGGPSGQDNKLDEYRKGAGGAGLNGVGIIRAI